LRFATTYIDLGKQCGKKVLKAAWGRLRMRPFGTESWEGSLNTNSNATEKSSEQATAKKPYKTPALRFESVFEVSALSCGKIAGTTGTCNAVPKFS
jgi:hypothetical protein